MSRLLTAALVLFSAQAHGATIGGSVMDDSGKPVPYASVVIRPPDDEYGPGVSSLEWLRNDRGVFAKESGRWEMDGVRGGRYQLVVRHIAIETWSSTITVPDSGYAVFPVSAHRALRSTFPPVPRVGVVRHAETGEPLADVSVLSWLVGDEPSGLNTPRSYRRARTDSTGSYRITPRTKTSVVFVTSGFEALTLIWPDDLYQDCGDCCVRLRDAHLRPISP